MFKKTLTATVAALTLTAAVTTTAAPAQAGSLGKAVAIGVFGAAVGAIAGAIGSKSARADEDDRPRYDDRREVRYEHRAVRGGRGSDCGYERQPVLNRFGEQVGWQRVPAC